MQARTLLATSRGDADLPTRWESANGRLSCIVHGNLTMADTVVILIHGFAGAAKQWDAAATLLRERTDGELATIAVDLPGHGNTHAGPSQDVYAAAHSVTEITRRMAANARVVLIGHAHGTAVALAAYDAEPDRVVGLALLAGATRFEPWRSAAEHASRACLEEATPAARELVLSAWRDFRPGPRAFETVDVGHLLARVAVRTLVLAAGDDQAVPFRSSRELARAVPGALFAVVPTARHHLHIERPRAVSEALAGFHAGLLRIDPPAARRGGQQATTA